MLIKYKKGKMELAVTILVLTTLVLTIFALYTFHTRGSTIRETLYLSNFLENLYAREDLINFHVNEMLEQSIIKFNKSQDTTEQIINNFTLQLEKYKENSNIPEDLEKVEAQINENPDIFTLEEDKITLELTLSLNATETANKEKIAFANYTYTKKFEKEI